MRSSFSLVSGKQGGPQKSEKGKGGANSGEVTRFFHVGSLVTCKTPISEALGNPAAFRRVSIQSEGQKGPRNGFLLRLEHHPQKGGSLFLSETLKACICTAWLQIFVFPLGLTSRCIRKACARHWGQRTAYIEAWKTPFRAPKGLSAQNPTPTADSLRKQGRKPRATHRNAPC